MLEECQILMREFLFQSILGKGLEENEPGLTAGGRRISIWENHLHLSDLTYISNITIHNAILLY